MDKYMKEAFNKCKVSMDNGEGGPFGAIIVSKEGEILAISNNRVLIDNDPTAHAEICAIRKASQKLNSYDLSGCTLYTTCEPCPMCLSAIVWSNIKKVYYGATREDAKILGFRDDDLYNYFNGTNKNLVELINIDKSECSNLFKEYKGKIY